MSLHLSLRLPTLLTSAPSSGKFLLLSHLAATIHPGVANQIITIPLADTSLDPRALLGSYVSSPTKPGTFEWREGLLIRAMRAGRWVVLQDVDRGTSEVLGTLLPLVESLGPSKAIGGHARIRVPARGEVTAHENFALFATRSLQPSRLGFARPAFFGAHKFAEVVVGTPLTEELRTIVDARFPRLAGPAADGIIALWGAIKGLGTPSAGRAVGLRELDKFCTRICAILPSSYQPAHAAATAVAVSADDVPAVLPQVFASPVLREDILTESRDVFFGGGAHSASARAHVIHSAVLAAQHLGLSPEQRDWVLGGRVPDFQREADANGETVALRLGRVRLPAAGAKPGVAPPIMRPFALHKPALALMARIGAALALGEPVLLTGETGTGKTSIVAHMAGTLRRNLIALNLSQQSEAADLLGGFRPVDARVPGAALQDRFVDLFRETFSVKKNAGFEEGCARAVREIRWKRAVGLWRESARMARERVETKLEEAW
jgi:midasin